MPQRQPRAHPTSSQALTATLSILAIAVLISLGVSVRDKASADRSRETQGALSRIEIQVQDVHILAWLAIAAQEITPEGEAQFLSSTRELLTGTSRLRLQTHGEPHDQFDPTVQNFIQAAGRQLVLIRSGSSRRHDAWTSKRLVNRSTYYCTTFTKRAKKKAVQRR